MHLAGPSSNTPWVRRRRPGRPSPLRAAWSWSQLEGRLLSVAQLWSTHSKLQSEQVYVATFPQTSSVFVFTYLLPPLHQPIRCRAGVSKCISTDGGNWCELNQHSSASSTSEKRILYGYSWICQYSALSFSKGVLDRPPEDKAVMGWKQLKRAVPAVIGQMNQWHQ